jgi:hypothetical protein
MSAHAPPGRWKMMKYRMVLFALVVACASSLIVLAAALEVPTDIQQPGTQPGEAGKIESPDKCENCHGGYNVSVEPGFNWRGSMMAHATRDPLFWAAVAVAEQGFEGSGDLCLRCHSPDGWLSGRSTPTNGSALRVGDVEGVTCDTCHKMTNPDNSEWLGVQSAPFIANDGLSPATGYYGSGMYSIWSGSAKLGPYVDAQARHQSLPSQFHRSSAFCGTCHDVSNPAVGDLAPNNGAFRALAAGTFSGVPGSPVSGKAAFNNFPFAYGVVERTFSEHMASAYPSTRVADYATLPADLKSGAIAAAYESSRLAGRGGDYEDGTPRYFTCQTCHVRAVIGEGCNKKPPVRRDLPLHDMTGGNYWVPDAIRYLDARGRLRAGGGLTAWQLDAMEAGKARALKQLSSAASLAVNGNTVEIINLTGHKLLSGYPEGRRMWLNIKWYNDTGTLVREDGAYGDVATIGGRPVRSIIDLYGANTKIYEAHYGITPDWASSLLQLGHPSNMPLAYNRVSGATTLTLGQLAASSGPQKTFHFVLNNTILNDNRIPPYGFSYTEAERRNALPVPASQYGGGAGGVFNYWDVISLNPPAGATYATIDLLYQPTSWEYIQFLYLANDGRDSFLASTGADLLEAWLNTGMAEPYAMASATWGTPAQQEDTAMRVTTFVTGSVSKKGVFQETTDFRRTDTVTFRLTVASGSMNVPGAQVFIEVRDAAGSLVTAIQAFTDSVGFAEAEWNTQRSHAVGQYTATVVDVTKSGYSFDPQTGSATATFTLR